MMEIPTAVKDVFIYQSRAYASLSSMFCVYYLCVLFQSLHLMTRSLPHLQHRLLLLIEKNENGSGHGTAAVLLPGFAIN